MPPLKINVTGKSSVSHAPELCTLKFSVKAQGPEQNAVARDVTAAARDLQLWFQRFRLHDGDFAEPPVKKFWTSNIKAWSKPKDEDDKPVADPHHATISFTAVFHEFEAMGKAVSGLLAIPKVEIKSIDWSLTDETGKKLSSETRKLALRDAIQQADDLSEVLGRNVGVVEIFDAGYSSPPMRRYMMAAADFSDDSRSEPLALDLTPQEIDVETSLQVTFEAV
ncbi:uncharacterized protein N7529_005076 [Penicillium soppii]|uniref:uncharacterized protein n=1 Tax=Penicillium soppii TaxID=69789 RepID=UPI0025486A32|nr:uncharacterized protein N7529_005076 [Penicillium soppii]KAJ5872723.1 hypothetical protein N7529_005076 [Penicillium soppii]